MCLTQVAPKIARATEIRNELDYAEGFLRQIKQFAGDNLDRVVEMSSIFKSLQQVNVHSMFPECSPNVPRMFPECSLNVS
jgi:hypothetical protein